MKKLLTSSIILVVFLGFLVIPSAYAVTISKDTAAVTYGATPGHSLTSGAFTVAANSNRLLIAGITVFQTGGTPSKITSVTWNGVPMTNLPSANASSAVLNNDRTEIWYLVAPSTGAHTAVVTFSSNNPTSATIGLLSLYNASQNSPPLQTGNGTNGNNAFDGVAITPTNSGSWLFGIAARTSGTAIVFSDTSDWTESTGAVTGAQHKVTPTIGSKNVLGFGVTTAEFATSGAEVLAFVPPTPAVPTLTHANTLNSTAIKLDFPPSPGATFYLIKQASPYTGVYTQIANITTNTLTVNGLTPGTQYGFKVAAGNSSNTSAFSALKSNYTKNIAPTGLTASLITPTTTRISVTPPSGNFSGFLVYKTTPASNIYNYLLAGTSSNTTARFDLTGLSDNTQYQVEFSTRYAVGTNSSGVSANSTTVSFYSAPYPPTSLAISQTVVNQLNLQWGASPSSGISGYKIERSIDFGATWITLVANTGNTLTTYVDSGLTTGNTYTYRISTVGTGTNSVPTSNVSATVLSSIQLSPTGSNIGVFDMSVPSISWNTMSRNSSAWDMFVDTSNNGTAVSWYHINSGSSSLNKILGFGQATITITGTPNVDFNNGYKSAFDGYGLQSNAGWIYLVNTAKSVDHYYIGNGTKKHDFSVADCAKGVGYDWLVVNQNSQPLWNTYTDGGACASTITSKTIANNTLGNVDINANSQLGSITSNTFMLWDFNSTTGASTSNQCALWQVNSNFTNVVLPDNLACDWSIQQTVQKYYFGIPISKQANTYSTNATTLFTKTNTLQTNTKLLMTADNNVLRISNNVPNVRFILHTASGDYIVIVTQTQIYYQLASTVISAIQSPTRAYQSYYLLPYTTTSFTTSTFTSYQPMKLYASGINNTENIMGLTQLISGFTYKGTSTESAIRTVDPRWTNDLTNIPLLTTTGSLYQVFLTVSNAPTNAAIMVTNPGVTLSSIASVWTVTQLDATHSAEFDIPTNQCGLVYVTDTSSLPTLWDYEGQICATGVNQKTIAFVNTLPLSFYTLTYGVSDSFVPSTNGLTTMFHTTVPNTAYTVTIKNSTGVTAQQFSFSMAANQTLQTENFNLTGVSKPATLAVSVGGNTIFTTYLGSPLSLASVSSFFHQYFNYQGFDLLAFIPLIFASMFTRNTVGIGMAMVVVCIATLSFLSVVVISDTTIFIMVLIAAAGMIGYRSLYG